MEAALKLARQYFAEIGEPRRHRFVGRRQSYHGNTLGALAVGGNAPRRELFRSLLTEATLSHSATHRRMQAGETEEAYGCRVADEFGGAILPLGTETVTAFVAETVVRATLDAVPPVPGYLRRIHEVCDCYGIPLILDEVMNGMGRIGTLHA